MTDQSLVATSRAKRYAFFVVGWVCFALGIVGVFLPGIPTTGPMIAAAACFARSSPRFETWMLSLPSVGPMVRDYRAGLGMARRAKVYAIGTMAVVGGASVVLLHDRVALLAVVVVLLLVGMAYVLWRVPTREHVLQARLD